MPLIQIQSMSEFQKYTGSSKLTVVDFYADWCGPCKAIAPRFEQMSNQYPNVQFLKVNVDNVSDVSASCQIRAMPTFQFYQNGKKLNEVVGADINKVESLVKSGGGAASGSAGLGKGYVLGSGKPVSGASGQDNTSVYMFLAIAGLMAYIYFSK
ncbi:thioredoxin-like protein [Globomyces pollinis-pini]|nr:thioredoxin-like protein [Globomyces pollinis-pini]KAJ2988095.1 hypothetical protein HDV02_005818 [Globomyces sp. JEL0801]